MLMQSLVINWTRKNFVVVEEMQLLPVRQRDLRMFLQKIMQCSRARLLRTGDNKIESLDSATFHAEHRANRAATVARCPRLSYF